MVPSQKIRYMMCLSLWGKPKTTTLKGPFTPSWHLHLPRSTHHPSISNGLSSCPSPGHLLLSYTLLVSLHCNSQWSLHTTIPIPTHNTGLLWGTSSGLGAGGRGGMKRNSMVGCTSTVRTSAGWKKKNKIFFSDKYRSAMIVNYRY